MILVITSGCSRQPPTRDGFTNVIGTVTLDGQPLKNAQLIFETDKGISYARTDASGRYQAEYSRSLSGVGKGKATVRISTKVSFPDEDVSSFKRDPRSGDLEKEELVPPKYNSKSELIVEIKDDGGPYDFRLTSKRPPDAATE
jgi:hypothetical protein